MKREGGTMEPYPKRLKLNPEGDEVAAEEEEINVVGEEDEVVAADEEIAVDRAGGEIREGKRERGSMDPAGEEEEDEVLAADEEIAVDKEDDSNKDLSDEEDKVPAADGKIAVGNDESNGESSDNDDSNDESSDGSDSNDDSSDEEDNEPEVLIVQIERNLGLVTGRGRLAHFAVGALNRIVLTRYRVIRRQERRRIIEYLLTTWGKDAILERLSSIYADIEHPQFEPRLEALKKEDLIGCYLGTLGSVDEQSGEKLIEKIRKVFSKLDRAQLRREWAALLRDSRMEFCLRLVENFFLGSVADAAVRGCSSNLMAEVVLYRYVYEGVDGPSFVNGNSRIIWLEVVGSLTVTYGTEQLGCHYLIDAMFREIFEIVCRGESVEAVHSLEKMLWCNPLSLRSTETREFLMLRLAQALGGMEEETREVTRTIVFNMLNISQRDAGQNGDIVREVEHLLGIRSGAIVAKVIKSPKPKRRV